ncbi:MAG: preprotein translocase subunit SecE, partial [Deltaproteobacteria bacterium CG_4_9_14_3_um_filter_44_9]
MVNEIIKFLREVKVELKKVSWPSRKETIGST